MGREKKGKIYERSSTELGDKEQKGQIFIGITLEWVRGVS